MKFLPNTCFGAHARTIQARHMVFKVQRFRVYVAALKIRIRLFRVLYWSVLQVVIWNPESLPPRSIQSIYSSVSALTPGAR